MAWGEGADVAEGLRLLPAESIALTVARAQVQRGAAVSPNTATVLVMALDRLLAGADTWEPEHGPGSPDDRHGPRPGTEQAGVIGSATTDEGAEPMTPQVAQGGVVAPEVARTLTVAEADPVPLAHLAVDASGRVEVLEPPTRRLPLDLLQFLPTLRVGQAANLKIDTGRTRYWLSRMTTEDGATCDNEVVVQRLEGDRWMTVDTYEAR